MEEQTPLRIGLVGCGWHGHNLAKAIAITKSLRLVACADPDEAAASRAAMVVPEVSTHRSVEALLDECEVDAIVIATPHHLLSRVALVGLRAGKHVLPEKPIALNEREAIEVENSAAQAGTCYMPGYSMRFSIGRYVHDLLAQRAVGEIKAITAAIVCPPLNDGWIAYPETGGGPLLFLGCHLVDLVLWFLADSPTEIYANVRYRGDTTADDTSAFQIRFAKGVLAQCLVSQAASNYYYQIDIYGGTGKISLRGYSFDHFEIEVSSHAVEAYQNPTVIRPSPGDYITSMLVPELEEFASAIREQRAPMVTMNDGRRVLRVIDAVGESGRTNQPVILHHDFDLLTSL